MSGARGLASAVPDFTLALVFLIAWTRPDVLRLDVLRWLPQVMLLEFIVVHSSGFTAVVAYGDGSRRRRALLVAGLSAFYLLFALGFALAFRSAWPVVAFVMLTLNRMLSVMLSPSSGSARLNLAITSWAGSAVVYLFGALFSVATPVPRFGLTPEVVARMALPGGGEWIERPWTVIAFGCVYFAVVGCGELLVPRLEARFERREPRGRSASTRRTGR